MKLAVPDLIQFQKHLISSDIELHLHITIIIMILLHSFFRRGIKLMVMRDCLNLASRLLFTTKLEGLKKYL